VTALAYPLTIYYDESCPVCATEMAAIKVRDVHQRLELIDCSTPTFDDAEANSAGVSREAMMRVIHAHDARGTWLHGIDVFVAAYTAVNVPLMAKLWGSRLLRPFWNRAYPWIARHRQTLSRIGLQHAVRPLISLAAPCRASHQTQLTKQCASDTCQASSTPLDTASRISRHGLVDR
jgi:predicted DCC family thiol-disulfide oxidoreductase YuxK